MKEDLHASRVTRHASPQCEDAHGRLADRIDALLPQTQCTRCGYPACRPYAEAVAAGEADIDRCPPGGAETVRALATLLGVDPVPLDPACGEESPRQVAVVDESWCIGCTLCIEACPVDAIIGAPRRMHTVMDAWCTGCELCVEPCPVDCISMVPAREGPATPAEWRARRAGPARERWMRRESRRARARSARAGRVLADLPASVEARRDVVRAARERARARRDRSHGAGR